MVTPPSTRRVLPAPLHRGPHVAPRAPMESMGHIGRCRCQGRSGGRADGERVHCIGWTHHRAVLPGAASGCRGRGVRPSLRHARSIVGQRYRMIARQLCPLTSPSPTETFFSLSAPRSRPSSPTLDEGGRRLPIHRRVRAPVTPSNMPIGGCVAFRSLPSPRRSLSSAWAPKRLLASQLSWVGCLARAIHSKMS